MKAQLLKKLSLTSLLMLSGLACMPSCVHNAAPTRVHLAPNVEWKVEVHDLVTDRNAQGMLEAEARCMNDSFSVRHYEYKFEWYDASGMVINSHHSRWTQTTVDNGSPFQIKGVAPSAKAHNFKLFVRQQNR